MDTKALAISIALAAVAMILNPAITGMRIPAPFLTGLYYQVWDIPIIVCFLLLGFRYGLLSSILNGFFLLAVFPGPSQWLYAPGNVAAEASMMAGIWLARKLLTRPNPAKLLETGKPTNRGKIVAASTISGILVRIPVMLPIMFLILRFGYFAPDSYIIFLALPIQAAYCVVMALYTIPVAYLIAIVVNKNLRVGNQVI